MDSAVRPIGPAPASPPGSPAVAPPSAAGSGPKPQRRLRNYLLDAGLQLRLASHLLAVATALSLGLGWLLWQAYRETSRVIALGDPDVAESLGQALAREDRWRIVLVSAALAVVLLCLLGAAVVITHRIAGPAFAIARTCRRVGEGDLSRPRPLRSGDLLVDLAGVVAEMVDALRSREDRERETALRAAAALRDPSAAPGDRAGAAEALERLASDKTTRLGS
jgi:hypothetical protein